jgi:hypothetical protein
MGSNIFFRITARKRISSIHTQNNQIFLREEKDNAFKETSLFMAMEKITTLQHLVK